MDEIFKNALGTELIWFPEKGWGYCPTLGFDYGDTYYETYVNLEDGEICAPLNEARVDLVTRHIGVSELLDIGVGAGTFVSRRMQKFNMTNNTYGYDINPRGIDWLKEKGLWLDPYEKEPESVRTMTFWDSLEHIPKPAPLLSRIGWYAFVSMPIYENADHLVNSKHFKKNEHIYYFTADGLVGWMKEYGFDLLEQNTLEVDCGREDIGTFVFRRVGVIS